MAVLSFMWESLYMRKTVFILRWGPVICTHPSRLISHICGSLSVRAIMGDTIMMTWLHPLSSGHRHILLHMYSLVVWYGLHRWISRSVETTVKLIPYTGLHCITLPYTYTAIDRRRGLLKSIPNISLAPLWTNLQVVRSPSWRNVDSCNWLV